MQLIKLMKVSKPKYKKYDSDCTAKKHISKILQYQSTDVTWVQIKPYIIEKYSVKTANIDRLSHNWVLSS
jgi:hypothetical protein